MLYRRKDNGALARFVQTAANQDHGSMAIIRDVRNDALHAMPVDKFVQEFDKVTDEEFDVVADIEEFHERFGLTYKGKPRALPDEMQELRNKLAREELDEYLLAVDRCANAIKSYQDLFGTDRDDMIAENLEDMLDALVDLVYVALGTAVACHGFDFRTAWRRVHDANMRKVRANNAGDSKRGSALDVIKPAGWKPPSHSDLVSDHAHRRVPVFSTGNEHPYDNEFDDKPGILSAFRRGFDKVTSVIRE